jgi:hypothetical protein
MPLTNLWTLCAIVAIPAIAALYWIQPRIRVRRIGGLFLWAEVAQSAVPPIAQRRSHFFAIFDLLTASLLVALAIGILPWDSVSADLKDNWPATGLRGLLCAAIAGLLITVWRYSASEQASQ